MSDTSNQLILMCDCPEIQDMWRPETGDQFAIKWRTEKYKHLPLPIVTLCEPTRTPEQEGRDQCIWIPCQDQLQGMVQEFYRDSVSLLLGFTRWYKESDDYKKYEGSINSKSMDELWIEFVMFKKFNKEWKGKKWASQ